MSAGGRGEQIERELDYLFHSKRKVVQHSHKKHKKRKLRTERRRAKKDPECLPEYRRYNGWEW